jgi:hypothetical protein
MRRRLFSWGKVVILPAALTVFLAACASVQETQAPVSQPAAEAQKSPKSEFRALCNNIAASGGGLKITKDEYLAASKDKAKAERVFNMCDVKKRGYITDEDVDLMKIQELKSTLAEPADENTVRPKWQKDIHIIQPKK